MIDGQSPRQGAAFESPPNVAYDLWEPDLPAAPPPSRLRELLHAIDDAAAQTSDIPDPDTASPAWVRLTALLEALGLVAVVVTLSGRRIPSRHGGDR
ncbi:hypothetical protein [Nonomuraea sp. NPDC049784]|uniref:hypothetical protein n=1 Tax=Nonomuraea sp. NPDC049784 TaxID=3154361 RepID=UPI00340349AA